MSVSVLSVSGGGDCWWSSAGTPWGVVTKLVGKTHAAHTQHHKFWVRVCVRARMCECACKWCNDIKTRSSNKCRSFPWKMIMRQWGSCRTVFTAGISHTHTQAHKHTYIHTDTRMRTVTDSNHWLWSMGEDTCRTPAAEFTPQRHCQANDALR